MIKNIIFDLGNVLISFKPSEYLDKMEFDEDFKQRALTYIFGSQEWLKLDNGDLTLGEAIESIARKSPLKRHEIARIFDLRIEMMFPLEKNAEMLPELKNKGFMLYYLSNFPIDIFDEIKNRYNFFNCFAGGIISAEVRYSKPDRKIYESLLQKYMLRPEECLFIDDIEANVIGAESVGMKGYITFGSHEISTGLSQVLTW